MNPFAAFSAAASPGFAAAFVRLRTGNDRLRQTALMMRVTLGLLLVRIGVERLASPGNGSALGFFPGLYRNASYASAKLQKALGTVTAKTGLESNLDPQVALAAMAWTLPVILLVLVMLRSEAFVTR